MSLTMDRVAVITGASSGIGKATAIALAADGWKLVLTARREDALRETASSCSDTEVCILAGDITDEEHVMALFETALNQFGHLDLLFNNAGIGSLPLPTEEIPLATFQSVLNVNVTAAFLCTREAVRIFKSQSPHGGRIINNGSISAHTPRPLSMPYTVSKHAITGLTKSTALDNRKYNIACTQIDIGNAATEMTERMSKGVLQPNGQTVPEPTMDVKHIADTIVQIAGLPNDVTVLQITIMATEMPFVGRG